MLKSTHWSDSLRGDWPTPFKSVEVEDEEVVQPEFSVATTENEHLVVDDARGVELSHGSFSANDTRDIKTELVNTFLKVNKDNIGEHLKSIPATVDDNLTAIPNLG